MLPIVAAVLGGAVAVTGRHFYSKRKAAKPKVVKKKEPGLFDDLRSLVKDLKEVAASMYVEVNTQVHEFTVDELDPLRQVLNEQGQKLTVVMTRSAMTISHGVRAARDEVRTVAVSAYEEIKPIQEAVGEEWRGFSTVLEQEEGLVAEGAKAAVNLVNSAVEHTAALGKTMREATPSWSSPRHRRANPSIKLTPKAVWESLKQAKSLVLDDSRDRQFEEMSGPADGSARAQIVRTEKVVNRYLKVAVTSVATATIGVLFFAPLKLVSGGLILYAAFPVFQGAYIDLTHGRRITIRLLDSVSFLGLLAGGYFLICSLTATVFHSSTKMMLRTEDRSRRILADMFGEQPRSVWIVVDGQEIEVPFEQLAVGDTLVVHAGQTIPVDGKITGGTASVDQHVLTGEAQPAEKGVGDRVFSATMLLAGRIEVVVEQAGSETAAAQIRNILATTTDFRSAIQARWKEVADHTVLPTLGLAGVAMAFLSPASALAVVNSNYVSVLKVASPLGMLNFLQRASQSGVLIKDGRSLEAVGTIDTVVFDKTGTLTETQPHVGEICAIAGFTEEEVLTSAAAVEAKQSHPVALAILSAARERNLTLPSLEDERYEMGYGIQARVSGRLVRVGSARYMKMEGIEVSSDLETRKQRMQSVGASVIFVAIGDRLAGMLELRPTIRPEAKQVVKDLKDRGLTLYIISGDHAAPTQALAAELGIDHYLAEVLPQEKSSRVEELQKEGKRVCFVGDGINDAIALKKANVSISIRGASTLATDTAQIILMDESLRRLNKVFEVGSEYDANLKTLIGTTFGPGLVSLGAVFFLGAGNLTALGLFNLSMLAGLMNAIWPALQQQQQQGMEPVEVEQETSVSAQGD